MNREVLVFGTIIAIAAFVILFAPGQSITGLTVNEDTQENAKDGPTFAYTLDDFSRQFFNVHTIEFPKHACGQLAHSYLDNLFYDSLSVYEQIGAQSNGERAKTIMFGIEEHTAGALEMIHGNALLDMDHTDFIGVLAHRGVRVPRLERDTILEIRAFGDTNSLFNVREGSFRTAMLECEFDETSCKCSNDVTYDYGADEIRLPAGYFPD